MTEKSEQRKPEKDPETGRFVTGNIGGPGRGKGNRYRLGEKFVAALKKDFEAHGDEVIAQVREERPHEYLKVLASILPKQMEVNVSPLEEMTDDQLRSHAARLLEELGPVLAFAGGPDADGGEAETRH